MSLFQLPVSPPAPDHGVSSMYMQKVEPNQPVAQSAQFGSQKLQFQINPAANEWFIPNRSYFRFRFSITQYSGAGGGAPLPIGSAIDTTNNALIQYRWVPAYGMCSRLFNGCNFYVGSTLVSSINSNLPQVDSIHKRTTLSRTQLDSSDGLYQSDPKKRLAQLFGIDAEDIVSLTPIAPATTVAALPGSAATQTEFEIVWSPPLGVMDIAHGMPSGQYRWEFNGNPNFARDVADGLDLAERVNAVNAVAQVADTYLFTVQSMVLYACYARGPSGEDTKFALNLRQIRVQTQDLVTGSTALQLKNFDVDADTSALALAFQGSSVNGTGNNRYGGAGLFKIGASDQKNLQRWYIAYDNSVYPPEQNEDLFSATEALISQRYRDTHTQTGMIYSPGGAEALFQWLSESGPYYLVNWPRVQGTATRVQINAQLSSATQFSVLLVSISEQSYLIRTSDGKVRKVEMGE